MQIFYIIILHWTRLNTSFGFILKMKKLTIQILNEIKINEYNY